MEYITSRNRELPKKSDVFEADLRFHLWEKRFWPYEEIIKGDILYWYETPTKSIVWKTRIEDVERFPYSSKPEVRQKLVTRFHDFNSTQDYFLNAPDHGYCLALKIKALERVNFQKPEGARFPQLGWMRIDNDVAASWLIQKEHLDDVTLDELVTEGSLIDKIHNLNLMMKEVSPKRVDSIISRTIRQDTPIVRALKALSNYQCQFPQCTARIPQRNGGYYIEVAHIHPVSRGGRSIIGNLLVLCPNHHKEFDYGLLEIENQTETSIQGSLNGKTFHILYPGASEKS